MTGRWLLAVLALVYLGVLGAGFLAPHDPLEQHRDHPYEQPTQLHLIDAWGRTHLRPFVYGPPESPAVHPVRFFVRGARYRVAGPVTSDVHLFGTEGPARIFLFGTDEYGRDVFSRLLYGGRISLLAGLFGAALALAAGVMLGALSGFYGSWVDDVVMRLAELFLALPWLYLLLAVRMMLPLHLDPGQALLLLVGVLGIVGWARPARLVRGVVLSAVVRDHVVAARGLGASDLRLLWRHVLPQVTGVVLTQAALLVPQYTLAEVTLSFFGLGVSEPVPSWGNMLASLQHYHVLASYWWMFLPALALVPVFLLYYLLADALHQQAAYSS